MALTGAMMETCGDTGQARRWSRHSRDLCLFFSPTQIALYMDRLVETVHFEAVQQPSHLFLFPAMRARTRQLTPRFSTNETELEQY